MQTKPDLRQEEGCQLHFFRAQIHVRVQSAVADTHAQLVLGDAACSFATSGIIRLSNFTQKQWILALCTKDLFAPCVLPHDERLYWLLKWHTSNACVTHLLTL